MSDYRTMNTNEKKDLLQMITFKLERVNNSYDLNADHGALILAYLALEKDLMLSEKMMEGDR